MDIATITKLKKKVEELTLEIRCKIPKNTHSQISINDFINELNDFRECETDYLVSLAEQCLERVAVALSNKTGRPIFVYKFEDDFIIFYFDSLFWKWTMTGSIKSAMQFISRTERGN